MTADPFGTDRLRAAVLDAWAASPTRFREDANAEEDHARGGYRDRVVVELAQNAADAAARAGAQGALLLALVDAPDGALLVAANTGAPLDSDGVASLASLRASAKRAGVPDGMSVGRFGVGFAAVRSVADDVAVLGTSGSVHFSGARTSDALAGLPAVAEEVAHRKGVLPALRLPFPGPGPVGDRSPVHPGDAVDPSTGSASHGKDRPEPGSEGDTWATVVVLRLRDTAAVAAVRDQLDAVGDPLLLALPALASVTVELDGRRRTVQDLRERWVVARRSGPVPADVLADRPVEERARTTWSVTWAAPRVSSGQLPPVVHAPTPTDEPSTVPALLVATFPLDPSRRHVPPGGLTDLVVAAAGQTWADLVLACAGAARAGTGAGAPEPLDLVPAGMPGGALDAALREAVVTTMRQVPFLPPLGGGPAVAPADATVVAGPAGDEVDLLTALGTRLSGLVAAAPRHRGALRTLGVEEAELADLVDTLPDLSPAEHRAVVGSVPATLLDALATLPTPLADGRTVRGARGAVVLAEQLPPDLVATLGERGLRVIHPDAVHDRHVRLGAEVLDVDGLLRHPVLRDQVLDAEGDDEEPAAVLLGLLSGAQAATSGRPEPWWGELLLPADDGEPVPARGLVLPGSEAARWFDPEVLPPVADDVVDRWGTGVLAAVGVRTGLPLAHVEPVPAGPDGPAGPAGPGGVADLVTATLDGWGDYLDDVGETSGQDVVGDLDAVRSHRWPDVLAAVVAQAPHVLRPLPDGRPSYVTWWLRERSGTGVCRPFALGVDELLPPAPDVVRGLDEPARRLLGGVDDVTGLDLAGWLALLAGTPEGAEVPLRAATALWSLLARETSRAGGLPRASSDLATCALPAWDGRRAVVTVDVVVAAPQWAQHPGVGPVVVVSAPVTRAVADLLDADLAEDRAAGRVTSRGVRRDVPPAVRRSWPDVPAAWWEHGRLEVDGTALRPLPGGAPWWVDDAGEVHATGPDGLARGLAAATRWSRRYGIAAVLADASNETAVHLEGAGETD